MTVKDDRAEFKAETRRHSLAMGQDVTLFEEARDMTVKAGQHRYAYLWTWMGVPIIQMPSDIVVTQEIIWRTRPDVIIETGVARGGSLVFSASMLAMIGSAGKVIGVDIDIRAHNRDTIEKHPMASRITLIQGSSVAPETVQRVKDEIPKYAKVMIVLDSDHSRDHVLNELRAYGPLVTKGQYLIVAD
ncbi:MAG TPA: CmcI family methyltransferase, partial [Beijerinckiaceae bacterium]|nr:CmcI family methyltransferase [Beijerinckiaceae bacterium]